LGGSENLGTPSTSGFPIDNQHFFADFEVPHFRKPPNFIGQWIHPQVLGKVLGPAARGAVQSLPLARGWHHSLVLLDLTFGRTQSSGNSWKFDGNYWLARACYI
jgi:hypothetical protein